MQNCNYKKAWRKVLTKTRNDLKRPTKSKKCPETTYNDLQRARNDLNDLQQARSDLKQSTMTKTQPTMT